MSIGAFIGSYTLNWLFDYESEGYGTMIDYDTADASCTNGTEWN